MPPGAPPRGPNILRHIGYSVAAPGAGADMYEGRPRITTRTKNLQGGVCYPKSLEGRMEAIVVDYEKDQGLARYINQIEQYANTVFHQMKLAGRAPKFEDLLGIIARKIFADFPYSHRMLDKRYREAAYPSGRKVHLGRIMEKQDMICRHMALLFGSTLEHLRDKNNPHMRIRSDTDIRYVADTQYDPLENDTSGHGYVVVKRFDGGHARYFVVDPTAGRSYDIRDLFKPSAREKSPGVYRYLFSVIRVVFRTMMCVMMRLNTGSLGYEKVMLKFSGYWRMRKMLMYEVAIWKAFAIFAGI